MTLLQNVYKWKCYRYQIEKSVDCVSGFERIPDHLNYLGQVNTNCVLYFWNKLVYLNIAFAAIIN